MPPTDILDRLETFEGRTIAGAYRKWRSLGLSGSLFLDGPYVGHTSLRADGTSLMVTAGGDPLVIPAGDRLYVGNVGFTLEDGWVCDVTYTPASQDVTVRVCIGDFTRFLQCGSGVAANIHTTWADVEVI